MASTTIAVTPGSGDAVTFDGVTLPDGSTTGKAQGVKVLVGGEGDALGWQGGREVDGTTDEAAAWVEQRPHVAETSSTPTISTSAYTAGDAVGSVISITSAAKATGGGVRIDSVTVIDKDAESPEFDLLFFSDSIAAVTDNVAFDPSDADLAKCRGGVQILSTDWSVLTDNAVASLIDVNHTIPVLVGTTLYMVVVIRSADTFTSTSDLTFVVGYTKL